MSYQQPAQNKSFVNSHGYSYSRPRIMNPAQIVYICMYIYIYIYIYICVCVCVCVCIYIFTHAAMSIRIGKVAHRPRMLRCTFESRRGCTDLYYTSGAQGVLTMRVGGATSQLDPPSLAPLSVAICN